MAKAIKAATHRLEADAELGIGFIQIGEDMIARGLSSQRAIPSPVEGRFWRQSAFSCGQHQTSPRQIASEWRCLAAR